MKRLFLLILLACISVSGFSQTPPASKNIDLLGHLSLASAGDVSNLWGYVAPNGTEYAIVGCEMGVSIISLANPANPIQTQFLSGVQTIWREVKVFSHYAYVVNEGGDGVRIIDLANLPGNVTYKDTVLAGIVTGHTVSETDGYLYINGYNGNQGGIKIFNLNNDPWRPEYIGEYSTRYIHDCYVRGNTIYAGAIYAGLLTIIDITNKANPTDIVTHSYANSFTHNAWLNDASTVCFTTDEVDAAYVYAWDITDLSNITELDKIRSSLSSGASIPHNIHVLNDFGVTSYYKDGVVIFDVSHPQSMVEIGYYDTSPQSGGGFAGAWGVFPYFPSGNIIVSDIQSGLYVLKPKYVRGCYLDGKITDANTGNPIAGATVTFTGGAENSLSNGNYYVGIADPTNLQVTYSKAGYVPQTFTLNLTTGNTVTQDVQLVPVQTVAYNITVLENGNNMPIANAKIEMNDGAGLLYNLNTATNGSVNNPTVTTNYTATVGKWGYKTRQLPINITGTGAITIYLDKGYYDDYYFDFAWTTTTTASAGAWERGEPVGTAQQNGTVINPDDDVTTDIGDQCYVTGNGGGAVGNDDVDGGYTELVSPSFDITNYVNPKVHYSYWFVNKDLANQGTPNDVLNVSIGNGNTIVGVKDHNTDASSWKQDSFAVNGVLPITNNMKVYFRVTDNSPGHILEGAIDEFWISGAPSSVDIDDPILENSVISINPNPSQGLFQLTYNVMSAQNVHLVAEVYSMVGVKVKEINLNGYAGVSTIDLSSEADGMYLIVIRNNGTTIRPFKVVKE